MSKEPLEVEAISWVASLSPYEAVEARDHVELRLDANEGMPPDGMLQRICQEAGGDLLCRYPSKTDLERRLAERLGVEPEAVLVTAGADDALDRALRAVCLPGRNVVVTSPSFEMYRRSARLAGAEVREVPWWTGDYPVRQVCSQASRETAAVTVVSPNNPTGSIISAAGLEELLDALPAALVLLDHAYVDFAHEDLTQVALSRPNGLVLRTFSKAWGCAGLRVGYAVGDPRVVTWLRSTGQPYPVSTLSLAAVLSLLQEDGSRRREYVETVRREREALFLALEGLGAEPLRSQANFVLASFADADAVMQALDRRGVRVRSFSRPSSLEAHLRITLPGHHEHFRWLLERLEAAMTEIQEGGA